MGVHYKILLEFVWEFSQLSVGYKEINPEEGLWLDRLGCPSQPRPKVRCETLGQLIYHSLNPPLWPARQCHAILSRTHNRVGSRRMRTCKEKSFSPKKGLWQSHGHWCTSGGRQPPQFDTLVVFRTTGQMRVFALTACLLAIHKSKLITEDLTFLSWWL